MHVRTLLVACLATALGLAALPARAEIPTMTVSELHSGMSGIGKTVARGTEIEEFQCEIIDIFTNMGYNHGPLILVRLWGDVIDETGGIAGGYSGSPVFIDGKLIGAISWGPWFTEGDVAGVTPIHEMLRAFTYPDEEPQRISYEPTCLDEPIETAGREFDRVMLADSSADGSRLESLYGENTLILTPCRTPLIVSGLSEAGFERLRQFANDRLPYMDLIQGPGGGSSQGVPILFGPTVLEPGASIGAQLASGDLDLTAIGTLTWVHEDGRFLAFGHPFFGDGVTNMPFVTTRVVYTMPALDRSYKLGEPMDVVGTITQDRLACVGGMLREIPDMVEFHLTVVDHDTGRTQRFNYSVINKEDWLPFLGWLVPMEGLMFGSDRLGHGTCRISFSIRGEGLARPIERNNLVYASYDLSESLNEFLEALSMVTLSNPYREVKLTSVDIEVEATSARQTMEIMRARFNNAPNMGPGAVGYAGPEEINEKEAKDEATSEPAEPPSLQFDDLQEIPVEDMQMYMSEMMGTEEYAQQVPPTGLVKYRPGDTIEVLVTLRPYRKEPIEQVVKLEIPEDFPAGQTSLEIFGGSYASFYGSMSYYYMDPLAEAYPYGANMFSPPEDLDEVIEDFMERDTANTIIVQLMRMGPEDPYFYLQDEYEPPEPIQASLTMEDVIFGYFSLPIEIAAKDSEAVPTEQPTDQGSPGITEPPQETQPSGSRNPHRQ